MKSTTLKTLATSLLLLCLAFPQSAEAGLFKKKKANTETQSQKEKNDSNSFKKTLGDAKCFPGMFDAYLKKDGKLFLALSDTVYDHTYLLVSRVNGISRTSDMVAGEMNVTPILIKFSKDPYNIYMHIVQDGAMINQEDPIASSFERNFMNPVIKGFKIKMTEDGKDFIDVTSFFKGDEKIISPIKEVSPIAMLLSGKKGLNASFYEDGSAITKVKSFPDNLMIDSRLAFTTDKATKPYTVSLSRSIIQLPDEPMRPRLQDNRVGYFYDAKDFYSSDLDGVESFQIIDRFRIEPKDEEREAYFAGKLVEPKQKIIFYVDSAFPEKWKPAVKEGIEYWNKGFEAAGFKNVIEARDYPKNDSTFDADNIRTNCVRYCVTPTANAMGPSYVDPRTGEILGADVIWYHNVLKLVHDWRFVQTGAVDPRVRTKVFPDSVMYESLTYVTAHEIGHCLGLMHNMGGSYAYTLENLRDPEFTQTYGTTPSIMDYARNNFVAQPGDLERGVRLTPPPIGVYDIHAINWGYRLIPDAETLFDEKPVLDSWIREHDGDPMYEFGAQQVLGIMDPTDQTEDLSNDHMGAGDLSISNLRIIMDNLEDWAGEAGENYEALNKKYQAVVNQYSRHILHVFPYIGGVRFKEIRQGHDDGDARNYFSKIDQKRAMEWLLNQARTCYWLEPENLISKFDEPSDWRRKMERSMIGCFTSPVALGRIKRGYEADPASGYKVEDFLDDAFRNVFMASYQNLPLDDTELNLQTTAITTLAKVSGLENLAGLNLSGKSLDAIEEYEAFVSINSVPAVACSHECHRELEDGSRSFYRIALGDNPLPEGELKPLFALQLRKIRDLYKTCVRTAPDAKSKEFYKYQLKLINKMLED